MPKLKKQFPKMCRDRNQCFSWYNGKRIYHGKWGTPEADRNYKRFIARLLENPTLPLLDKKTDDVLVSELAAGFLDYIEHQQDKTEFSHFKRAIGYLIEFHGGLAVNEFSPKKLKVCRSQMVKTGTLCRRMVNNYTGRIIRIFAWGVEEEVVQSNVIHALQAVKTLREGEQGAFDNPPQQAVPDEVVKRTLPFLSPTVAAMVKLQRITGMRPSEIYRMTAGDIDKSKEQDGLWHYVLKTHKTEKRVGYGKVIPLGKPEQKLITPYLVGKTAGESVFSPRRASQERRERQRTERKTKVSPSQQERDKRRAKKPADKTGNFYDKHSYRKAKEHAIRKGKKALKKKQKIPHWTPYQLRHSAGTEAEKTGGLDNAQALLGHRTANVTKRYAHGQLAIAESMARNRQNPFDDVPTD
jgi:integrase